MHHLGYSSCLVDPDVWMRPALKADRSECEYILLYTDDALAIGVSPELMLRKEIGCFFELKESSIGPPKIYLSGHTCKVVLENGMEAWGFSSSQDMPEAIKNVKRHLVTKDQKLPARPDTPIQTSYRPELDVKNIGSQGCIILQIPHWCSMLDG